MAGWTAHKFNKNIYDVGYGCMLTSKDSAWAVTAPLVRSFLWRTERCKTLFEYRVNLTAEDATERQISLGCEVAMLREMRKGLQRAVSNGRP